MQRAGEVAAQQELNGLAGMLSSSVDITRGRVDLYVIHATPALQEQLDDEHGQGGPRVSGTEVVPSEYGDEPAFG